MTPLKYSVKPSYIGLFFSSLSSAICTSSVMIRRSSLGLRFARSESEGPDRNIHSRPAPLSGRALVAEIRDGQDRADEFDERGRRIIGRR